MGVEDVRSFVRSVAGGLWSVPNLVGDRRGDIIMDI